MREPLLQLRRDVEIREGPSSHLVLTSTAAARTLRVSGGARDLLAALRRGATFQQCLGTLAHAGGDSERKVRLFLIMLQEAGVLVSADSDAPEPRRAEPRGWTVSVPVSERVQDRLRPWLTIISSELADLVVLGVMALCLVAMARFVATVGNPFALAMADWSWPAATAAVLPWMLIHETSHVAAAIGVHARVLAVNGGVSVWPIRIRTYVTIDPCTLPLRLRHRLALPAAGPVADVLMCGGVAAAGLLQPAAETHAVMATVLSTGLILTALTLLPIGATDVATMVTIARQADSTGAGVRTWHRIVGGAGLAGAAVVSALALHALWRIAV
jgi:hypothetical protein